MQICKTQAKPTQANNICTMANFHTIWARCCFFSTALRCYYFFFVLQMMMHYQLANIHELFGFGRIRGSFNRTVWHGEKWRNEINYSADTLRSQCDKAFVKIWLLFFCFYLVMAWRRGCHCHCCHYHKYLWSVARLISYFAFSLCPLFVVETFKWNSILFLFFSTDIVFLSIFTVSLSYCSYKWFLSIWNFCLFVFFSMLEKSNNPNLLVRMLWMFGIFM